MTVSDAMQFLRQWPTQRMHLWSKVPDDSTNAGHTFDRTEEGYAAAEAWIASRNGKANLYFVVNDIDVTLGVDRRDDKVIHAPRETDVTRMVATHVDTDPRVPPPTDLAGMSPEDIAAHFEAEKARILGVYESYATPRMNVIVFTGGGMQGYHLFKDPVVIDGDEAKIADWKLLNIYLKRESKSLNADKCESLQHVMRLPGTINVPDAKKRARGHTAVEAALVRFDGPHLWYDVASLPKADPTPDEGRHADGFKDTGAYERIKPTDTRLDHVEEKWIKLGLDGDTENKYLDRDGKTDRSRMALAFCRVLVAAKVDDQVIASILMDPAWKVGECIRDKGGETKRQLKRTIKRAHEFLDQEMEGPAILGSDTWMKSAALFLIRECPDLVHYNDEFYVYKGIAYRATEAITVRQLVGKFLHKAKIRKLKQEGDAAKEFILEPFNPNTSNINEMMNSLTVICHVDRDDIETASWKVSAV